MELKNLAPLLIIVGASVAIPAHAEQGPMGFFVTSVGSGNGGNLGGLEGADAFTVLQRTESLSD